MKTILMIICLVAMPAALQAQASQLDRAIVIVNGEPVTYSEYLVQLRRQALQSGQPPVDSAGKVDQALLRLLIDERIQLQRADAAGIRVTAQEVDDIINRTAAQNGMTVQQLASNLSDQGISASEFRQGITARARIQRLTDTVIGAAVSVSDAEIQYHLQSHRELYATDESYELSHLFVPTEGLDENAISREKANLAKIIESVESGLAVEEAIQNYSQGTDVHVQQGYWGWRKEEQLPDVFLRHLRDTPVGGLTGLIDSANGLYLLRVHAKQGDLKVVTQQKIQHILVQPNRRGLTGEETRILLADIRDEILSTGDFAQQARLNSDDPQSAQGGGDLGWINPGDTAPAFEEMAYGLQINEVSQPIQTPFGWHIIRVTERREKDIAHDISKQRARGEVFRRKFNERYNIWLDRLREDSFIEYLVNQATPE